ncbi:MAG TPA: head completion/stabilization protein [Rhodospirillales bacterium]
MSFSGFTDDAVPATVSNDGWWPDIAVSDFQSLYRIPAEYETEMVADALGQGMAWANRQLAEWRTEKETAGHAALIDVPGDQLGNETLFVRHYRRAVFCRAKALLMPQFKTMMRRTDARNEAVESEQTEDKFYEYAEQAVADFLGRGRVNVELL